MNKVLTVKIGVILLMTLGLLIVISLISGIISQRKHYQTEAKHAVAKSWTGKQSMLAPIIVIPYTISWDKRQSDSNGKTNYKTHYQYGYRYVIPDNLKVTSSINVETRHQGIYGIPVYSGLFNLQGRFDLSFKEIEKAIQLPVAQAHIKLDTPFLSVAISDARGINKMPTLTMSKGSYTFKAGSMLHFYEQGVHVLLPRLLEGMNDHKTMDFELEFDLRGTERLSFNPIGLDFELSMKSNWPHPKFSGAFIPLNRSISDEGFEANWKVGNLASNIEEKLHNCMGNNCEPLLENAIAIEFIEPVNIYLQSERSRKYALLFIGIVFLTFFIFEVVKGLPIHPIQYGLVGFAITVFYLLLMSLSEHIGFGRAYFTAALACSLLIGFYLTHVLKSFRTAATFILMLLLLYAVLFVVVSAEDYALLMGSFLVFLILAIAMIVTRNIDWYSAGNQLQTLEKTHLKHDGITEKKQQNVNKD